MNNVQDLLINLLATLIGFFVGWLRAETGYRVRHRRARYFWRQFVSADLHLVLGLQEEQQLKWWEWSGLVGAGDGSALLELQRHLDRIRMDEFKVVYGDRLAGEARSGGLVLIGGPDANRITYEVMERLATTFRFEDPLRHHVAILDMQTGTRYGLRRDIEEQTITDHGIVIRTANPFNPRASVLIIAGCFGYGTWAGAHLLTDADFLKESLVTSKAAFECLFSTEVVAQTPQRTTILCMRGLEDDQGLGQLDRH